MSRSLCICQSLIADITRSLGNLEVKSMQHTATTFMFY